MRWNERALLLRRRHYRRAEPLKWNHVEGKITKQSHFTEESAKHTLLLLVSLARRENRSDWRTEVVQWFQMLGS